MNTLSEQIRKARPSASALSAPQSKPRVASNENAAAEFSFGVVLSTISSTPSTNPASQTHASREHAATKTCYTTAKAVAAQERVKTAQTAAQNNENSITPSGGQDIDKQQTASPVTQGAASQTDAPGNDAADLQDTIPTGQPATQNQNGQEVLSGKQDPGERSTVPLVRQGFMAQTGVLIDSESPPVADDIFTTPQTTDKSGLGAKPSFSISTSSSATVQVLGRNGILPAVPDTGEQLSNLQGERAVKELLSSFTTVNLSESANHESSSFPADREGTWGPSSMPNKDLPAQGSADVTLQAGRETALLQQSAQSTGGALAASKMRPEGAGSTARAFNELDVNGNKAYISHDGNRLAVTLEPDGLGKLNINLSLDRGMVNAQIHASDPASRNLIENNIQQIVNSLMHEGLSVGGFSVSLRHGEAGSGDQQGINDLSEASKKDVTEIVGDRSYDRNGRISIFV